MIAVLQRVRRAAVAVRGLEVARIGPGLLVLLGIAAGDGPGEVDLLARKTAGLRIFEDQDGRMSRSVVDVGGEALVVSQFTLLADCRRGRRPAFTAAAPPAVAEPLYEAFARVLAERGVPTNRGCFGAMMDVELVNDGPVTIVLDTADLGGER